MRWQDLRQSTNIQDLRGGRGMAIGGGGLGMIVVALAALICGIDPRQLLVGDGTDSQVPQQQQQQRPGPNRGNQPVDQNRQFASAVLGSTEDAWGQILPQQARIRYTAPKLVLYEGQISSACGYTSS